MMRAVITVGKGPVEGKWEPDDVKADAGWVRISLGDGDEILLYHHSKDEGARLAIALQQAAERLLFNLEPPHEPPPIEPGDVPVSTMCDEGCPNGGE
jgi:hypothetical protein